MTISTQLAEDVAALCVSKQVWLSLNTTDASGRTPGTEVSGAPFARVQPAVTVGTVDGTQVQTATFTLPTGASTTLKSWSAWTAQTGGTCVACGPLDQSYTLPSGTTVTLPLRTTVS